MMNFKKADAGLTVLLVIIIASLAFSWITNLSGRECISNKKCASDEYCGSDFTCHKIPVIEKTEVENNLVIPAVIIAISIVIAALILKSGRFRLVRAKPKEKKDFHREENLHKEEKEFQNVQKPRLRAP